MAAWTDEVIVPPFFVLSKRRLIRKDLLSARQIGGQTIIVLPSLLVLEKPQKTKIYRINSLQFAAVALKAGRRTA